MWVHARRALLDSLTERAERAERERALATELAIAHDRARLAADVHHTVGHWVSLMVLQAGALTVSTDDEGVHRAADAIQAYGGEAITELRDLLRQVPPGDAGDAVREDDDAHPADLPLGRLVERARRAGLSVTTQQRGLREPPDEGEQRGLVAQTAYRVVQEALTNASRHAPGSHVVVVVDRQPRETSVDVTNTASPEPSITARSRDGGGIGLIGLRRRVALVDGHLEAHTLDNGGFRVRAVLPSPSATPKDHP